MNPDGRPAAHIVGVSVPRSGHNLVVRLLQALMAGDLFYCERYLTSGCCQVLPCVRRETRRLSFQKSHDLQHDLPRDLADAFYLVQHRAPVPAVLSAREMYADEYGEAIAGDRDEYAVWLGRWAEYLVTFHERWIADPPANGVVVEYDDLIGRPADVLQQIVTAAGIQATDADVETAVATTMPRGGICGERPFVPRSIEGSRYFDRELLAAFESIVVDALPGYAPGRAFEPVGYGGTPIWHVFAALRAQRTGDVETAIRRLGEALERWPENGMVSFEQAWLFLKQDRYADAQRLLERSAELLPSHPQVLDLLVTAALAAGDSAGALGPMRALATDAAPTLANRLRLAKVLAHSSDRAGAAAILDEVTGEAPDDAEVWRDVAEVRLVRGELSEARIALETAIGLAPLQADLYRRHGNVLLKLGKPGRAADALRQALALDPRQPAWWSSLVEALRAADDRAGIIQAVHEACTRLPGDARLQAEMAEARRRALATSSGSGRPPERSGSASMRPMQRFVGAVGRLPGARLIGRAGRAASRLHRRCLGSPGDDAIQVAQLRAALGVAEHRLADAERRMHQEVEAAWTQATRLEGTLQQLDTSLAEAMREREAGWKQAHALADALEAQARDAVATRDQVGRLGAALAEQRQNAEAAWEQARCLDSALAAQRRDAEAAWEQARQLDAALASQARNAETARAEHARSAEAAWEQARTLDAALTQNGRALQAALAEIERLSVTVGEQNRELHVAWRQAHLLDKALEEKERELQASRLRVWRLEEALRLSSPTADRLTAGLISLTRTG